VRSLLLHQSGFSKELRNSQMSPTKNHILVLLSGSKKASFGKEDFPVNPCRKECSLRGGPSNQKQQRGLLSVFPQQHRRLYVVCG